MGNKMINLIDKLSKIAGMISAIFMVLIVVLVNLEIIVRTLFNKSTHIADEYSSYFLVVVVLMGLAYAMRHDAHIRVEVIRTRMNNSIKRSIDILCFLFAIILSSYATYYAIFMTHDVYVVGVTADSISETPLYLPQLIIPVGLILFILQLMASLIRRLQNDN